MLNDFDYRAFGSSRKLRGAFEHLIDGSEKRICKLVPAQYLDVKHSIFSNEINRCLVLPNVTEKYRLGSYPTVANRLIYVTTEKVHVMRVTGSTEFYFCTTHLEI